jgi:hypothetical protein
MCTPARILNICEGQTIRKRKKKSIAIHFASIKSSLKVKLGFIHRAPSPKEMLNALLNVMLFCFFGERQHTQRVGE